MELSEELVRKIFKDKEIMFGDFWVDDDFDNIYKAIEEIVKQCNK